MTDTVQQQAGNPSDLASPAQAEQFQERPEQAGGTAELARQMDGDASTDAAPEQAGEPLFPAEEANQLRDRWQDVQAGFVDEPRRAVQQADELVAGAIKRIAQTFADERGQLEGQWDRGDQVSTEDLRVALQKYRTFFGRLLNI